MPNFRLRSVQSGDRNWISQFITERWGSEIVIVHNILYTPADLPGVVAVQNETRVGLVTYIIQGDECEIVTLDSISPSIGIGKGLVEAVLKVARESGCRRVWLITTNDNLQALRFYQKRGFQLVAIYRNAVDESRKIKSEIPILGENGIPIRDEIELEMILGISD